MAGRATTSDRLWRGALDHNQAGWSADNAKRTASGASCRCAVIISRSPVSLRALFTTRPLCARASTVLRYRVDILHARQARSNRITFSTAVVSASVRPMLIYIPNAVVTTTIRLRFDGRSTLVRLRFDIWPCAQPVMIAVAPAAVDTFVPPRSIICLSKALLHQNATTSSKKTSLAKATPLSLRYDRIHRPQSYFISSSIHLPIHAVRT